MISRSWARWCLFGWLAQLYLVCTLPEVADEAYYARWGEALSLGYLDHPPGVALWAWGGGRWLNLTLLPLAWWLFAQATRRLGSPWNPVILVAVAWWTPLGLSSGVIFTPDSPLLLGWSIAVWGYAHQRSLVSALGVVIGAWSKAMIWPAALGLAWLWLTDKRASRSTNLARLALWTLCCVTLYLPHLWWSWTHDGLPWTFQGARRWGRFSTVEWIAGQLLVGGGMWALTLGNLYIRMARRASSRSPHMVQDHHDAQARSPDLQEATNAVALSREERARVWWWLSAPSALIWLCVSLGMRVEANWSALAWPMGLAWVLDHVTARQARRHHVWGILCTLPCLALPLVHHLIPLGWGPPRDGDALAACLHVGESRAEHISKTLPKTLWVTGRYQEAALLGLPLSLARSSNFDATRLGAALTYQRAWDRRQSQYDLARSSRDGLGGASENRRKHEPLTRGMPCNSIYLGPSTWVGPRCSGVLTPLRGVWDRCRVRATRCMCDPISSPDQDKPRSPSRLDRQ